MCGGVWKKRDKPGGRAPRTPLFCDSVGPRDGGNRERGHTHRITPTKEAYVPTREKQRIVPPRRAASSRKTKNRTASESEKKNETREKPRIVP
eukprot:555911-Prymnesium_polylepis.1